MRNTLPGGKRQARGAGHGAVDKHGESLLSTVSLSEAPSLLAMVPENAHALVHCRDISQLRARADRNDWYRLLGTEHGEPFMGAFAQAVQTEVHGDLDELLGG